MSPTAVEYKPTANTAGNIMQHHYQIIVIVFHVIAYDLLALFVLFLFDNNEYYLTLQIV